MISLVRPRWPVWPGLAALCILSCVASAPPAAMAQVDPNAACVKVEIFTRPGSDQCERAVDYLRQLQRRRPGIRVDVIDVAADRAALQRLKDLATRSRIAFSVPTIVAMGQVVIGFRDEATTGRQIEGLLNVEIFIRDGCPRCAQAMPYIQGIQPRFPGLRVITYETTTDVYAQNRIQELSRWYNTTAPGLPLFHVGGRLIVGWNGIELTGSEVETVLRNHCGPCEPPPSAAPAPTPAPAPATTPAPKPIVSEPAATPTPAPEPSPSPAPKPEAPTPVMAEPPASSSPPPAPAAPSAEPAPTVAPEPAPAPAPEPAPVPSETPAPSVEPPKGDAPPPPSATSDPPPPPPLTEPGDADESTSSAWPSSSSPSAARLAPRARRDRFADEFALVLIAIQAQTPPPAAAGDDLGLPPEADLPPEAPIGASPATAPTGPVRAITADEAREPSRSTVKVPVLGTLDVRKLGMPAFTFLIGLIDGFNPCAMWVLVFLLSVLAGLNDRRKLIIVAGTFVLISGLAYFIFMAAWLNVFRLIGLVRWAQIALGVLAVGMGAIHIKDFFAFKKGLSLSIPESAKPGIYAKVRKIAAAESLWVALGTAIVMAVLVNMVELLCTAGLPALYTSILSYQGYPRLVEYLYLGLYILAYMFDDTILLLVVAVTLSRRRLQEREGRWLKLVSGVVILALGIVMLFAPTWLV